MRTARFALPLFLLVAVASVAQQHPNVERGFLPDKSYQVADVDAVNLFNGILNLSIPLGQRYPVNGNLSYQFLLSYATNHWDTSEHIVVEWEQLPSGDAVRHEFHYLYSHPDKGDNAGFGWLLNFGYLDVGVYVSPDGARHGFYPTLHANSQETAYTGTSPLSVGYTRDGTYLRRKEYASEWVVEFPNGDAHTFAKPSGKLTAMRDAFGNSVDFAYGVRDAGEFAGSSKWTITDSTGRSHYAYFRPSLNFSNSSAGEMLDYLDIAAFDGSRAEYRLEYASDGTSGQPPGVPLMRRCTNAEPPVASMTDPIRTPMLSAIQMPLGLRYEMQYDLGYDPPAAPVGCSPISFDATVRAAGNLRSLRLPTGATIQYQYAPWYFPGSSVWSFDPLVGYPILNVVYALVPGIRSRIVTDRDGTKVLSDTEYAADQAGGVRFVRQRDGSAVVTEERHYFTACVSFGCSNEREYGLPFTRAGAPSQGPFLSTEMLTRNSAGNLVVTRTTKVIYEGDGDLNLLPIPGPDPKGEVNRRMRLMRTEYDDGRYVEVAYSDFDGLGSYRRADAVDNFGTALNTRVTITNFNPGVGTLLVTGNSVGGSFIMPPATAKWLWTTYDKEQVTEGGVTSTSKSCFNANGFLTSRRVYAAFGNAPAPQAQDLLAIFQPDPNGNVAEEQYLGGDVETPPVGTGGTPAPVTSSCVESSASETYRIKHLYAEGVRKASFPVAAGGTPVTPFILDTEVDENTGLAKTRRELTTPQSGGQSSDDGLNTTLQYDAVGRLTQETPEGLNRGARRRYEFGANGATVRIVEEKSTGELLREGILELDGLGQATKETRSIPNGLTASRQWEYDGLGRVRKSSSWGNSPLFTQFEYDGLGRLTSQTAPDGSVTTFGYTGVRVSTTTKRVRMNGSADTSLTTTMTYDGQGRVRTIQEPNGPITRYAYDFAGHLTEVCADESSDCFQRRTFTYDNRGFLTGEQMPELGVNGNGTTSYRYDARGNVVRRTAGAQNGNFDVWLGYDRAGRLERVYEAKTTDGVHRNLKLFTYGTSNSGGDYRNGRVTEARRYNWFTDPAPGFGWQIVEKHTYTGRDGRIWKRETNDHECIGAASICNPVSAGQVKRRFEVTFSYDELGAVTTIDQPSCLHAGCQGLIPARTVTNEYDNGWLESVTWSGAPRSTSIGYHHNGMVKEVVHGNLVKDEIALDPAAPMPRPYMMTTTNVTESTACTVPSFTTHPRSQTITAPNNASFTVSATGQAGQAIHYQWYIGPAPVKTTPTGTDSSSLTLTQPANGTQVWAEAWNSCSPANQRTESQTATLTVCTPPSFSGGGNPQSRTITRGQEVELAGSAAGSGTIRYQWYRVSGVWPIAITGQTSDRIRVSPTATTIYKLEAANDCGTVMSAIATVTVANPPTTPANVAVSFDGTRNTISWSASTSSVGILRYEIRRGDGAMFATIPSLTSLNDGPGGLQMSTGYRYEVRAVDNNGISSPWSTPDITVTMTFTDDPVLSNLTVIRGVHLGQLRQAIDAHRVAAGLPPAWTGYGPAIGVIAAAHVTEMRARLNEARIAAGIPAFSFTHVIAPSVPIRAIDIQELRTGVK